jgi:hypothetical protein
MNKLHKDSIKWLLILQLLNVYNYFLVSEQFVNTSKQSLVY